MGMSMPLLCGNIAVKPELCNTPHTKCMDIDLSIVWWQTLCHEKGDVVIYFRQQLPEYMFFVSVVYTIGLAW